MPNSKSGAHTSKNMGAVLGSQVKFNPITAGEVSKGPLAETKGSDQSKSKGKASALMLALNTFLNSSNVMVPELSLWGHFRSRPAQHNHTKEGGGHTHRNTERRRSNPRQAASTTSRIPRNLPKTPNRVWRYPRHETRWRTVFFRFWSSPPKERWP